MSTDIVDIFAALNTILIDPASNIKIVKKEFFSYSKVMEGENADTPAEHYPFVCFGLGIFEEVAKGANIGDANDVQLTIPIFYYDIVDGLEEAAGKTSQDKNAEILDNMRTIFQLPANQAIICNNPNWAYDSMNAVPHFYGLLEDTPNLTAVVFDLLFTF